jgi:lipoprotein-anchoring transpeptidase ErfK/SrfK
MKKCLMSRFLIVMMLLGVNAFAANEAIRYSKILALQIYLDRAGLSPHTIDGQCGRKAQVALATYCAVKNVVVPSTLEEAKDILFPNENDIFSIALVTQGDYDLLTSIPDSPEGKSKLPRMGYSTIKEMFAERGHLSQATLVRLNPNLKWPNPPIGSKVLIPYFPPVKGRGLATALRVSLSRFEITAFDEKGRLLALFPCSIAAEKSKLPPKGEIHVTAYAPSPNYTYTPDYVKKGERVKKYIFPPGPNNPVGNAWISLSLPTYGIHGTPNPESIGRAESHGCFRLANWNASRLLSLIDVGTSVVIE